MKELSTLIEETRSGNLAAYDDIVRRFQDMAVGYAASLLGDYHLAEDAAQEAFIYAYLDLGKLRETAAFPGWFRQVVHSQCQRIRRRQQPVADPEIAESIADHAASPQDELSARESRDQLLDALQVLNERDRSITTLFYMQQFTQKEIAAFLGVPLSTINSRLYTARKRLQGELEKMATQNARQRTSHDEVFAHNVQQRLQGIETLHGELATGLETVIAQTLDQQTSVRILSVEQTTVNTFVDALTSPSLSLHFRLEPSGGRVVFDLPPELALAVEEKVIGFGGAQWSEVHNRMSDEQWAEMAPFGHALEEHIRRTWQSVMAVELADLEWETNVVGFLRSPEFRQLPGAEKLADLRDAPEGLVVRVVLTVETGDLHSQIALCYPAAALETLLPHMH